MMKKLLIIFLLFVLTGLLIAKPAPVKNYHDNDVYDKHNYAREDRLPELMNDLNQEEILKLREEIEETEIIQKTVGKTEARYLYTRSSIEMPLYTADLNSGDVQVLKDLAILGGRDTSNWVDSTYTNWIQSTDNAYSGQSYWCSDSSSYQDNWLDYIEIPQIAISDSGSVLSAMMQWETEYYYDGANVCISIDNGSTWILLEGSELYSEDVGFDRYGWSGSSGGWINVTFDLAAYADQDIKVRFYFYSDISITDTGLRIDDILVIDSLGTELFADDAEGSPLVSIKENHNIGSFGVQYWENGRLTELNLNNQDLTGSIPLEIGNLTSLYSLNLSRNQLSGAIPVEIGNLTNLSELYLHYNQLTGSIPVEIGNLTNLNYLILSSNQLSGFIPAEIGNLTNLSILYLYSNQLSGAIPVEIGNLTNLSNLYLIAP